VQPVKNTSGTELSNDAIFLAVRRLRASTAGDVGIAAGVDAKSGDCSELAAAVSVQEVSVGIILNDERVVNLRVEKTEDKDIDILRSVWAAPPLSKLVSHLCHI